MSREDEVLLGRVADALSGNPFTGTLEIGAGLRLSRAAARRIERSLLELRREGRAA